MDLARAVLVAAPALHNAYRGLQPLLAGVPHVNDVNFHQTLVRRMGEGGPDAWVPHWGGGAAVLRYYQNWAHLAAALAARLARAIGGEGGGGGAGGEGLEDAAVVVLNALFLALLPLALCFALRRLGFGRTAAAAAAALSVLVEADSEQKHFFGLQVRCFTWEGWGLYPQIVAIVWALVALGTGRQYIAFGRGFYLAAVALAFTWLSHLVVGYGLSILLLVYIFDGHHGLTIGTVRRWLALNVTAALSISYLVVPTLLESYILNRSRYEPAEYWDSYGTERVLDFFVHGHLLDRGTAQGAPAYFTYLVMAALAWIVIKALFAAIFFRPLTPHRKQGDTHVYLAFASFAGAFWLFCGRKAMGEFIHVMPFSVNLPFHRFFVHFQMFAIVLGGWFLGEVAGWIIYVLSKLRVNKTLSKTVLAAVCLAAVLMMAPPLWAKAEQVRSDLALQKTDLDGWWGQPMLELMQDAAKEVAKRPGRVYAGAKWNWGNKFDVKFMPMYTLWTARGIDLPNVGFMWHAMGLNSEMDFLFDEKRSDHHALFNVRYVLCHADALKPPFIRRSPVRVGHAVHEWTAATGYFDIVQVVTCFDAWRLTKDIFWSWRERYVLGSDHARKMHPRVALRAADRCRSPDESLDSGVAEGVILSQEGNVDDFRATIDCKDARGCSILVKITYHPNFVVHQGDSGRTIRTICVAPSYLAFVAPFGVETYRVVWTTPLWSSVLFYLCYAWMIGSLLLGLMQTFKSSTQMAADSANESGPKQKSE